MLLLGDKMENKLMAYVKCKKKYDNSVYIPLKDIDTPMIF